MHVAGGPTYKPWLKLEIISHTLTACQKKLGTFEHAFTAGKVQVSVVYQVLITVLINLGMHSKSQNVT